jgi:hypothetical protein
MSFFQFTQEKNASLDLKVSIEVCSITFILGREYFWPLWHKQGCGQHTVLQVAEAFYKIDNKYTFCRYDILKHRHFVTSKFCCYNILSHRHFVTSTFCHINIFFTLTFCHIDILSQWHFVTSTFCHINTLLLQHFKTLTFCHLKQLGFRHYVERHFFISATWNSTSNRSTIMPSLENVPLADHPSNAYW